jgi:hypothetical protein
MSDDSTFFNTYLKVLKAKFDRSMADAVNLETQLIIANEQIESQKQQIELLQKNINKLEKSSTAKD